MKKTPENRILENDTSKYIKPEETSENIYQYHIISRLSCKNRPDVYLGTVPIFGKNYKIHEEIENNFSDIDEDIIMPNKAVVHFSDSSDNAEYMNLNRQTARYFNFENITKKCFKCSQTGHMSYNCLNVLPEISCFKCNLKGHSSYECKNFKCFKCNKYGHVSQACTGIMFQKCSSCLNSGHLDIDCLIFPLPINNNKNNTKCFTCGSSGHFLCNFFDKDNLFIMNDLFNQNMFARGSILKCPNCAGPHKFQNCSEKKIIYKDQCRTHYNKKGSR